MKENISIIEENKIIIYYTSTKYEILEILEKILEKEKNYKISNKEIELVLNDDNKYQISFILENYKWLIYNKETEYDEKYELYFASYNK